MPSISMPTHCERCSGPTTGIMMSMFNNQMLCYDCRDKERQHPTYNIACLAERTACANGNFNYTGIGLPVELIPTEL
jgi:hypothetical protein